MIAAWAWVCTRWVGWISILANPAVVSASVNSVLVKAPAMHAVHSVMSCNTVRVAWRVCFDMNQ